MHVADWLVIRSVWIIAIVPKQHLIRVYLTPPCASLRPGKLWTAFAAWEKGQLPSTPLCIEVGAYRPSLLLLIRVCQPGLHPADAARAEFKSRRSCGPCWLAVSASRHHSLNFQSVLRKFTSRILSDQRQRCWGSSDTLALLRFGSHRCRWLASGNGGPPEARERFFRRQQTSARHLLWSSAEFSPIPRRFQYQGRPSGSVQHNRRFLALPSAELQGDKTLYMGWDADDKTVPV